MTWEGKVEVEVGVGVGEGKSKRQKEHGKFEREGWGMGNGKEGNGKRGRLGKSRMLSHSTRLGPAHLLVVVREGACVMGLRLPTSSGNK